MRAQNQILFKLNEIICSSYDIFQYFVSHVGKMQMVIMIFSNGIYYYYNI